MDILGLIKAFSPYFFTEDDHAYTYYGEPVNTSVTTVLRDLSEPFDEAKWLPKKAKQLGVSEAALKAEWRKKADISTAKGTAVHRYMENALNGKRKDELFPEAHMLGVKDEVCEAYSKITPLCDKFLDDSFGKIIPLKTEFTIGLGTMLAGQIDLLAWNDTKKEVQIFDYKTNKEIKTAGGFSNFRAPVAHINNCELAHYSLQLGIYKEILARHGFTVGDLWIIWFNENNDKYKTFKCYDFAADCRTILNFLEAKQ